MKQPDPDKNEYRCATCGGIFVRSNTIEEALEEMKSNHFDPTVTPCIEVCDVCYNQIMAAHAN